MDYGLREQSKDEVLYAKELAQKHNLKCFAYSAKNIDSNFEANARSVRYDFFQNLIKEHNYTNLLTAHHLGDRFEWFMMQFCKGAGCAELAGMKVLETKENYSLIRPLLHIDKSELLEYLKINKIKYFEDHTNFDKLYTRNKFRHEITNPLISEHLDGIKKSFEYIDNDVDSLIDKIKVNTKDDFAYFISSNNKRSDVYAIDKYLKSIGYMLSSNERELLKASESVVVGRKYIISLYKNYIFIAPYISEEISMDKEFKEKMRKLGIDPKLRLYFYTHSEIFESLEFEKTFI